MSRERLQREICEMYGWEEWQEDPWGNQATFDQWLAVVLSEVDREGGIPGLLLQQLLVWTINETQGNTYFANGRIRELAPLATDELSKQIPSKLIMHWLGNGGAILLNLRNCLRKGKPDHECQLFPSEFMIRRIMITNQPAYVLYSHMIDSLYLWYVANKELETRIVEHPTATSFLRYYMATDSVAREGMRQDFTSEGYVPPSEESAWEQLESDLGGMLKQLAYKYKGVHRLQLAIDDTTLLEESYFAAREYLIKRLHKYQQNDWPRDRELLFDDIYTSMDGQLIGKLRKVVENALIDDLRKYDPGFAKRWRKADKPADREERRELKQRIRNEMPVWEKPPLSLDMEMDGEDQDTSTLLDLVQGVSHDEVERRETLDSLIREALTSRRQQLVIGLGRQGKTDREIVIALEEAFGKPTSERNVRKLRYDAIRKLQAVAEELPPAES